LNFSCPECDKTFNCPANLASHRRWHKPQSSASTIEPSSLLSTSQTSIVNKQGRCSSRSDSRSTNTSTSTVSDTNHEYSSLPSCSTSTTDLQRKDASLLIDETRQKMSNHILRTMYNESTPRMLPPLFPPMANVYTKHTALVSDHHRTLPLSMPAAFDFRRLQSACIFCHEQFSELNHLLQHIRKNHAAPSSEKNPNTCSMTLDKIVF
jgi:hypothetical protein